MLSFAMIRNAVALWVVVSVSAQTPCVSNLNLINSAENQLSSTATRRLYVLCPATTFVTGVIENGRLVGGQVPLNLRPNVTVNCGDDGDRANSCIITGGIGLLGSPGNFGDPDLGGVRLSGITFTNLTDVTFFVGPMNGNVQVHDCAFLNAGRTPSVYLQAAAVVSNRRNLHSNKNMDDLQKYQKRMRLEQISVADSRNLQGRHLQSQPSSLTELQVAFTNCLFEGNTNADPGSPAFAMIYHASVNQATTFRSCIFRQNDYGTVFSHPVTQSMIFTNGGYLELDTSCFIENNIRGFGMVTALGDTQPKINNTFSTIDPEGDGDCPFVAFFEGALPGSPLGPSSLRCVGADATTCAITTPQAPTPTAPVAPTPAPTNPCIASLNTILNTEILVTDLSVRRTYVLCPNTIFTTGSIGDDNTIQNGESPIQLRPNMTVQCGFDGSRSNGCVVTGGIGVLSSPLNSNGGDDLGLSVLEGITFDSIQNLTFFFALYNGELQIRDCAFLRSSTVPNIYVEGGITPARRSFRGLTQTTSTWMDILSSLQHEAGTRQGGRSLQDSSGILNTTFDGCLFEENSLTSGNQPGLNFTMIYLRGTNQKTTFRECVFRRNDFGSKFVNPVTQTLIYNNGGTLEMDTNCFYDNLVFIDGYAVSIGEVEPVLTNNFGVRPLTTFCEFLAYFNVPPGGPLVRSLCFDFDVTECRIGLSLDDGVPSGFPSLSPSMATITSDNEPSVSAEPSAPMVQPPLSQTPSVSSAPPPPVVCAERGELCTFSSDCCSLGCRATNEPFIRRCSGVSSGSTGNKDSLKLSAGQGGAGGSANQSPRRQAS